MSRPGGEVDHAIFSDTILDKECPHRQALLLHGKAWLQDIKIGGEGVPGRSWFNSSKRGLLAPFAVGTLDQALMAAMNVKHGFVRAFGLAGKVVILDEIHTYDAYTGTIIDALVKLLTELHCTVIILSATLDQHRRRELVGKGLSDGPSLKEAARYSGNPGIGYEYTVITNIYAGGLPAVEAGSVVAEKAMEVLQYQAAGNRLENILNSL